MFSKPLSSNFSGLEDLESLKDLVGHYIALKNAEFQPNWHMLAGQVPRQTWPAGKIMYYFSQAFAVIKLVVSKAS